MLVKVSPLTTLWVCCRVVVVEVVVIVEVEVVVVVAGLTLRFCPTLMRSPEILFHLRRSETETLYLLAIPPRVSPLATLCVPAPPPPAGAVFLTKNLCSI